MSWKRLEDALVLISRTLLTEAGLPLPLVMTRSALGSDPSPSCAQPGPTPGCFSQVTSRDAMHHVTRHAWAETPRGWTRLGAARGWVRARGRSSHNSHSPCCDFVSKECMVNIIRPLIDIAFTCLDKSFSYCNVSVSRIYLSEFGFKE